MRLPARMYRTVATVSSFVLGTGSEEPPAVPAELFLLALAVALLALGLRLPGYR